MNTTMQQLKALSPAKIDASAEIRGWLSQFPEGQRSLAKLLLSRLRFVSRDTYADWLRGAVASLPTGQVHALYSVRKLNDDQACYWNENGEPVTRPGSSLGSEDLVYSLISNQVRSGSGLLLDHPSLPDLKSKKVRSYVLIDDSIGSGDRVTGFINTMLNHPTVQPPIQKELAPIGLADSVEVLAFMDGDVGQTSLERSDAKTAAPSFSVTSQSPSASRKRRDTDGPKGPKER